MLGSHRCRLPVADDVSAGGLEHSSRQRADAHFAAVASRTADRCLSSRLAPQGERLVDDLDAETGGHFGLEDRADTAVMLDAISRTRGILSQPAMAALMKDDHALPPADEEMLRKGPGTAYHMAGTARMGRDPNAVCDPEMRLNSVERMRIADASIMPRIPNAAPHFPTMMIAAQVARFIAPSTQAKPSECSARSDG